MDELIVYAKKEVLVAMVKLAQKRGMAGRKGHWKEFLKVYDKKFGASLSDPSRRSVDALAAFLKTFTEEDDLKFFKKVLQCHSNREEVEQSNKMSPDNETAEQRLLLLTLSHPLYPVDYSFPSHEEEWLVVKCSKKSKKCAEMVAVDCEMVLCEDGTEALVKVCAVDCNLQVKLDEVVKPNKRVADYRTDITGISAADLEGVSCSLKDVQKSMKKLLSHGTILVGHSLSNDLQAMKLDHARVIDTSYVFKHTNGHVSKRPSLSLLCKAMLGYELRKEGDPHNCLDDACAAMKLVLARLEGRIDDVIAKEVMSTKSVAFCTTNQSQDMNQVKEMDVAQPEELDMTKLLLHRIPANILSQDLRDVLPGNFTVEVSKKSRDTYAAFAIFRNQQEAIEAFEKLEGVLEKDSVGRPQKRVKFVLGSGIAGTLYVCKTVPDFVSQFSKKRSVEDEDPIALKKCRTDQLDDSSQCVTHLKEIERLKEELRHRDREISNLNKRIAALARKRGL